MRRKVLGRGGGKTAVVKEGGTECPPRGRNSKSGNNTRGGGKKKQEGGTQKVREETPKTGDTMRGIDNLEKKKNSLRGRKVQRGKPLLKRGFLPRKDVRPKEKERRNTAKAFIQLLRAAKVRGRSLGIGDKKQKRPFGEKLERTFDQKRKKNRGRAFGKGSIRGGSHRKIQSPNYVLVHHGKKKTCRTRVEEKTKVPSQ